MTNNTTKTCPGCGKSKSSDEFHKNRTRPSGLSGWCKACDKSSCAKWDSNNREKRTAITRRWQAANPEQLAAIRTKWRADNPHKWKAQRAVFCAIRQGKLDRPTHCETCGSSKDLHYHHDSYARENWLNVRPLCRTCHSAWHSKHGSAPGFTAIELIVTLAILSIVLAIAMPNWAGTVRNSVIGTQRSELVTDFAVARSSAINFSTTTTLCARLADTEECDLDGEGPWNAGWLVFLDRNGNGEKDDESNEVRRIVDPNPDTSVIVRNSVLDGDVRRITFTPMGSAVGYAAKLIICDAQGIGPAKGMRLTPVGRVVEFIPDSCSGEPS